jgi:hypothetical protein
MRPGGQSARDPHEADAVVRRRRVPEREYADKVIVARPRDGAPVVLAATAAVVWRQLDGWTTTDEIDRILAATYPEVAPPERVAARTEVIAMLEDDDLLERA